MKMKINKIGAVALVMAGMFWSCSPNDDSTGNGTTPQELDASFTVTPVSANRFTVTAMSNANTITHKWDSGTGSVKGQPTKEIFLPDVGTYTITHTVTGVGGVAYSSSQTVEVTVADPVAGNIIRGGKFETAEDIAEWQVFPETIAGSAWTFANGEATMTGSVNWNHQHLYQAIQVEAGKTYKFDMKVKGLGNTMETYMEWYAGYNPPVSNDYNEGGQILALNTWAGCAIGPFEGQLSVVGCGGDTSLGLKTFPTSGTVYVVLRSASGQASNTPFSVTIDNVEVRRID
ncbi:MAG: hypothetical protein EOO50_13425 [Flavobacterium sp.]|uniref:hypothetical protein n=1 Tax=Flavobacterium sp. TaxID=239 RepID=UPI0011FE2CFA|nr:hypothetical protein [Flavobacterium sp.]RZJ65542.1 MAG: hypothetical protein EOO50_13425 [Flavobacterium sp.]